MDKRKSLSNTNSKIIKRFLVIHFIISFSILNLAKGGLTSKVVITDGGTAEFRNVIEERLTKIVNSFESQHWNNLNDCCTADGLASLKELAENTSCRNVSPLYEVKLLDLPGGGYEVRSIKVKIDMRKVKGNPYQYMVFTLDDSGLVSDVRFAMELLHYNKIIKEGERLKDFAYRQPILQFIEIFRTAYNRKDVDYLRKVYSEDALIIVGRVLEEKPGEGNYLEKSSLPKERIQLIKFSKKEYIERLEKIFRLNEFIKVNFEEVEVMRHPKISEIYGVTLKQNWHSSTYSDEGYLFLMMDFSDINRPQIHVRSWQPEKFPDGSVVNLGYFELIE